MKELKLKSQLETYQMLNCIEKDNMETFKDALDYIFKLENTLSNYQMALDQIKYFIDNHNVNVTR